MIDMRTMTTAMPRFVATCLVLAATMSLAPLSFAATDPPQSADFFVSPRGNDAWSGRLADPGPADGPFATLERAREHPLVHD